MRSIRSDSQSKMPHVLIRVPFKPQAEESKAAFTGGPCIHFERCKLAAWLLDYTWKVQIVRIKQQSAYFTGQCVLRTTCSIEKSKHIEKNRTINIARLACESSMQTFR